MSKAFRKSFAELVTRNMSKRIFLITILFLTNSLITLENTFGGPEELNVAYTPLTCSEVLGGKDHLTGFYDSVVTYGLRDLKNRVLYGVGIKPQFMFRGVRGPVAFLPKEFVGADMLVLNEKIRRLRERLGQHYNLGEKDPTALKQRPVTFLLLYLCEDVFSGMLRGSNFNLYPKEAESWATLGNLSKRPLKRLDRADDFAWAERFQSEVKRMAFILRTEVPSEQKFWPDRSGDETFGIMTKLRPEQFTDALKEESIFRIAYNGNWHRPTDQIMETWSSFSDFIQETASLVLNSPENESIESLLGKIQEIRKKSRLPF